MEFFKFNKVRFLGEGVICVFWFSDTLLRVFRLACCEEKKAFIDSLILLIFHKNILIFNSDNFVSSSRDLLQFLSWVG